MEKEREDSEEKAGKGRRGMGEGGRGKEKVVEPLNNSHC